MRAISTKFLLVGLFVVLIGVFLRSVLVDDVGVGLRDLGIFALVWLVMACVGFLANFMSGRGAFKSYDVFINLAVWGNLITIVLIPVALVVFVEFVQMLLLCLVFEIGIISGAKSFDALKSVGD